MLCKFCNEDNEFNIKGYCQTCYKYFILDKKTIWEKPSYGEIKYTPSGDCICPFCGKAFQKLGMHFYYSHHLTSREAHKAAGWDMTAKATSAAYRQKMRDRLQEKCVVENLLEKGKDTRFKTGVEQKRETSEMTKKRLKSGIRIKIY